VPLSKTELKNLKSLLTKKGRKKSGMFLAEGVRLLEESVRWRFLPRTVYYAPFMLSTRAEKLIRQLRGRAVETVQLSARDLRSMSDTESPQGIVGLFARPDTKLAKLYQPKHRKLVLCEDISDPGNLGTLARSSLAFGFDLMLLCGSSAEPYSPKVVRASAGAVFGLQIAVVTLKEVYAFVAQEEVTVIAADLKTEYDAKLPKRTLPKRRIVLAVGSEATGLSKGILQRADIRVRIQHLRAVESLNAAVAGSIIMKEIYDLSH
jgi:TrmH family RNA methyltransferase